jgi:hypothetical protein
MFLHQRRTIAEEQNELPSNDSSSSRKKETSRRKRRSQNIANWTSLVFVLLIAVFSISAFIRLRLSGAKFKMYSENAPLCEQLSVSQISFTLVTQLSSDRLWMMEYHCKRYPQAISIAVWTNNTLQETRDELEAMDCDLSIVHVDIIDASAGAYDDYPVNQLRNLALKSVQTSHVIYIDVDFWTSDHLFETLIESESVTNALIEDQKLAVVMPAFQLFRQCSEWKDCRDKNLPFMPYTKKDLLKIITDRRGNMFDPTNRGGHGSTLYKEWMRQDSGTLLELPCLQSNRYEPFLVLRYCRDLPPFQESFSGYGKNKMTFVMQLIHSGYSLSQIGGAYLVHYPHLDSASRQHWNEAPDQLKVFNKKIGSSQIRKPRETDQNLRFNTYKRGQIDQLFVDFRKWLEEQVPDQRRLEMCPEHQDDDAKLWVGRHA